MIGGAIQRHERRLKRYARRRQQAELDAFMASQRLRLAHLWWNAEQRIQQARREARLDGAALEMERRGFTFGGISNNPNTRRAEYDSAEAGL